MKSNYEIIRQAIEPNLSTFLYNYMLIKKQVYDTCLQYRYISPFENLLGDYRDDQVKNTYSCYADIAMETLLLALQPKMEEITGLKLNPTYTYSRVYKKGDILERHKDRFSCEYSTTLNLGGDEWPIFIEAEKNVGIPDENGITDVTENKGTKLILNKGDMLVYKGNLCEHWREEFTGNKCVQVFLHYNNVNSDNLNQNIFDGRPHIGLPSWFRNKNK